MIDVESKNPIVSLGACFKKFLADLEAQIPKDGEREGFLIAKILMGEDVKQ